MAVEQKLTRVEPDDPSRCQAVHKGYQCPFRAVGTKNLETNEWEGPKYCARHSGKTQSTQAAAEETRLYRLAQWQARLEQFADHPKVKSLREEIGVLRVVLEGKLESAKDQHSLLLMSGQIIELVRQIDKTVVSCHKIEKELGYVMDRPQAERFIQNILATLTMYVKDEMVLQLISDDIMEHLNEATNSGN